MKIDRCSWTKDWGQTSRSLETFDSFLSAVLIPKDYDSKKSPCEMNHLGHYLTVLSTWLLSTKQLAMWALTLKESVPPDLGRVSMFVWSNVDKRINVNLWLSQLGTGSFILVAICHFCFPQPFKDPKMSEDVTTLCLRLHWKKPTCRLPSWVLFFGSTSNKGVIDWVPGWCFCWCIVGLFEKSFQHVLAFSRELT